MLNKHIIENKKKITLNITAIMYQELINNRSWKRMYTNFVIAILERGWYIYFLLVEIIQPY